MRVLIEHRRIGPGARMAEESNSQGKRGFVNIEKRPAGRFVAGLLFSRRVRLRISFSRTLQPREWRMKNVKPPFFDEPRACDVLRSLTVHAIIPRSLSLPYPSLTPSLRNSSLLSSSQRPCNRVTPHITRGLLVCVSSESDVHTRGGTSSSPYPPDIISLVSFLSSARKCEERRNERLVRGYVYLIRGIA